MKRCPICGKHYQEESSCPICGVLLMDDDENTKKTKKTNKRKQGKTELEKTRGKGNYLLSRWMLAPTLVRIIVLLVVIAVICYIVVEVALNLAAKSMYDSIKKDVVTDQSTMKDSSDTLESNNNDNDISDVTLDMSEGSEIVSGTVEMLNNEEILRFDKNENIYLYDYDQNGYTVADDTEYAVLNDSSKVSLDNYIGENITVNSSMYMENGEVVIDILDIPGQEDTAEDQDYIIPDSNKRLLNNQDIVGLTAKELNYARNEIYARHGRMFNSKELMDYFETKSWYHGIYSPDEFDNNLSMQLLSDTEQKNAVFLREAENAMQSGGYSLDK